MRILMWFMPTSIFGVFIVKSQILTSYCNMIMNCKKLLLYISRAAFEELKRRDYCEFTEWINTQNADWCTHCVRILSLRLCIDELHDLRTGIIWKQHQKREVFARKMYWNVCDFIWRIYLNGRRTLGCSTRPVL